MIFGFGLIAVTVIVDSGSMKIWGQLMTIYMNTVDVIREASMHFDLERTFISIMDGSSIN